MINKSINSEWNWQPKFLIENNPLFYWPPNIKKIIKWYIPMWVSFSETTFCLIIALICWSFILPFLDNFKEFNYQWMSIIFLKNIIITFIVAGGLHLYLYSYKKQNNEFRYDIRNHTFGKRFKFNSQLLDNIYWTILSGVTIWSLYEIFFMWAYANNIISRISWNENLFWFCFIFFFMFSWISIHFYFIHRFLHIPFFYKLFHSVHHRNTNVGPWSGISMHPFEHILYFSSVLIHLIIPSSPLHVIFHLTVASLGAIIGHAGFDAIIFKNNKKVALAHFYHHLHHRYFECNYGALEVPFDEWFGTFHNGSIEATKFMREKRIKVHKT